MKPTLSLIAAFISAAFVSLVSAQESKSRAAEDPSADKSAEHASKDKDHAPPATQTEFIKTAAKKGMIEVKCAQLALAKSENAKVRELAAMLVKDHSAANGELKGIADKLDVSVPTELDGKAKKKHADLEKKSGKEFDTAFLNGMATSHRKGIALFEAGARVSNDEPVLAFIRKTLPTLRNHAGRVKELGGVDEEVRETTERELKEAPPAPVPPATDTPSPR
jgi:putative membrane protein